jgi:hypothetical protein
MKESELRNKFATELRTNNMETEQNDNLEVEWVPNGVRLAVEFSMQAAVHGAGKFLHEFPRRGNLQ